MNNLPKVVTQQRRGGASNPRLLDRKSDALPLNHCATLAVCHCSSELCVNINCQIGVHGQAPGGGGHVPQYPIASETNKHTPK